MPIWNARNTISRCISAILAQPLNGATLLVVDNCSEDDCGSLAQELLHGIPNCRVVRNTTNLGRVGNWNRCLELCESKYVKFCLVNDALMNGSLACLVNVAEKHCGIAMVCSHSRIDEVVGQEVPHVASSPDVRITHPDVTARYFAENGCRTGGLNGMLLNMEYVRKCGIRFHEDIPYCADYYFTLELAEQGNTAFVDTETYLFNASATGRFHFVGLQQPAAFFREQRECAKLLARQTGDALLAHQYLCGQYLWFLGQGAELQARDAWETFSHAPLGMRLRTTWATFRHNLKKRALCRQNAIQARASR